MFEQHDDHSFELVYVAYPNLKEASKISRVVIEKGLAACVNVIPGVLSFYKEEGQVVHAPEAILIAKTRAEARAELQEFLIQHHPYDTPGLVVFPFQEGHKPYLDWIIRATITTN